MPYLTLGYSCMIHMLFNDAISSAVESNERKIRKSGRGDGQALY
jgi:hypothetical protein